MGEFERAIQDFQERQRRVYQADPDRLRRDGAAAERVIGDHAGRWLLELLQNADDAGATEVRIRVDGTVLYVADNGTGIRPDAVKAISGTDLSDKKLGTIGRKGVGFKSVYTLTRNPQVLTVGGEGVEFSRDRAADWLRKCGFEDNNTPFQWIPFLVRWEDAIRQDPVLKTFMNYKTIVRLPLESKGTLQEIERTIQQWPAHALFALRHLRMIVGPDLCVSIERQAVGCDGVGQWRLNDSRDGSSTTWLVRWVRKEVPSRLLETLPETDRMAIGREPVGLLVAAPIVEGTVLVTSDHWPIHVFYPTERPAPVPLLLHAEFVVKGDRTDLLPLEGSPFNAWLADRLAELVCAFVDSVWREDAPSASLRCLRPLQNMQTHATTSALWERIAEAAKKRLRLADTKGRRRLRLEEARLVATTVEPALARNILQQTTVEVSLLHPGFDHDEEARAALRALGCKELTDADVLSAIRESAEHANADVGQLWHCWTWLAAWLGACPWYTDERKERKRIIESLPIVPIAGRRVAPNRLEGRVVAWSSEKAPTHLPDWLPLTFVDDWFRERISHLTDDDPVRKLLEELGIRPTGGDVVQRALGMAIDAWWHEPDEDPLRFFRFIVDQAWPEHTTRAPKDLTRCPLPLVAPIDGNEWVEARRAYIGREWGNEQLNRLYEGHEAVPWVARERLLGSGVDAERAKEVLLWLGAAECPRVIDVKTNLRLRGPNEDRTAWHAYVEASKDPEGRVADHVEKLQELEYIDIATLPRDRVTVLLRVLAKHWHYYKEHCTIYAHGRKSREYLYRRWRVESKWWWDVLQCTAVPKKGLPEQHVSLSQMFIPDEGITDEFGELLPTVDLDVFEEDKENVRVWLRDEVRLRREVRELTKEEWAHVLTERIPRLVSETKVGEHSSFRRLVRKWYEAFLRVARDWDDEPGPDFRTCPLLCTRAGKWQYVRDELRYLEDEPEIAGVFREDLWTITLSRELHAEAQRILGLQSLSRTVRRKAIPGGDSSKLPEALRARFEGTLPYIYAWRRHENASESGKLAQRLRRLKVVVVPSLYAELELHGMKRRVERAWETCTDTVYIREDKLHESELAQALAKTLGRSIEADFYENLLRCSDDSERIHKLLSKGVSEGDIRSFIEEYAHRDDHVKAPEGPSGTAVTETPPGPTEPSPTKSPGGGRGTERGAGVQAGVGAKGAAGPWNTGCRLKKPDMRYVVNTAARQGTDAAATSGTSPSGGSLGGSLSEESRKALEERGREFAIRLLRDKGYEAEEMPFDNPGYDIRAKKDGEELRVEVKSHLRSATRIELSLRQLKEYLRQERGGYRWELWNIEHLHADDQNNVTITRYSEISDEALEERTFVVDLAKCKNVPDTGTRSGNR